MIESEYYKKIYECAKKFLLDNTPKEATNEVIESYLNYSIKANSKNWTIEQLFLRFLESAQNANMKTSVIGGLINGVNKLS